ncbi:MAG: lysoplasmalogenase [Chloroflexi bacterium]|nr:lysoplasmalogenase [Chloroflexota bacterium]
MLEYIPLALGAAFAVLNWLAVSVWRRWKALEMVAKPAAMLCLVIWLYLQTGFQGAALWFGLGLSLSLVGDVLLLLFIEKLAGGLLAFLLAHAAYIAGLTHGMTELPLLWAGMLIVALGTSAVRVMRLIVTGVRAQGLTRLALPVQVYGFVISLMLFSAFLTLGRPEWQALPAGLVSLGAFLFYISDIILARNKFVHPHKYGRLANMATYHAGQFLLAAGAVLQFTAME